MCARGRRRHTCGGVRSDRFHDRMRCSAPGVFASPGLSLAFGQGVRSGLIPSELFRLSRSRPHACVPIVCSLACAGRGRCAGCCHPGALRRRVCCGPSLLPLSACARACAALVRVLAASHLIVVSCVSGCSAEGLLGAPPLEGGGAVPWTCCGSESAAAWPGGLPFAVIGLT